MEKSGLMLHHRSRVYFLSILISLYRRVHSCILAAPALTLWQLWWSNPNSFPGTALCLEYQLPNPWAQCSDPVGLIFDLKSKRAKRCIFLDNYVSSYQYIDSLIWVKVFENVISWMDSPVAICLLQMIWCKDIYNNVTYFTLQLEDFPCTATLKMLGRKV